MTPIARSVAAALLVVASAGAVAETANGPQEPAIARTASDPSLEWGPCPAFLPEGCAIAILHGDPAAPNVDVFFRLPGGAVLPAHTHTSAERMVLVAGELHVTYEGQTHTVLKPGSYAYGPAGRSHAGKCVSSDPCVLFIAFESPLDAIASRTEEVAGSPAE